MWRADTRDIYYQDGIFNRAEIVKIFINLLLQEFRESARANHPTALLVYFHEVRSLENYVEVPRSGSTLPPPFSEIYEKYIKLRAPEKDWIHSVLVT